jgi:microcystin-dependent protein
MAGTIPLSMTQQFDLYAQPLAGGQLYIIQAGTVSTPQDAFSDINLSIKMPYPIMLDSAGRIPQFFLADGYVKIRLQDKNGVVQLAADTVLVIGPSAGGGGGAAIDPSSLIQVGMMTFRHGTGPITGFVRLNNLTIGSSTSSATERANADCQNLFQFLWPDTTITISGGRGASALADWTANKQLSLPDWRGYALGALDDMGNSAAGRLSTTYFGSSPIVLGAVGGLESTTLVEAQIPPHYHVAGIYDPTHAHTYGTFRNNGIGGAGFVVYNAIAQDGTGGSNNITLGTNAAATGVRVNSDVGLDCTYRTGGGQAHRTIGPRKLVTFYMKL